MTLRKLLILLFVLAIVPASAVRAQSCLGLPSFVTTAVHLNVAGEFPDSATAFAVGIGAGRPNDLFGNLGGGQVSYDGLDGNSTFGFLEFGYQFPAGRAQICPIAGGSFGVGPDDDVAGTKVTSRAASAGLAIGFPIGSRTVKVIPNAGIKYEYLSVRVDEEGLDSITDTSNAGVVDLGLALVFIDRISIQPLAHIPIGSDDDEITFGIFASLSFGWPAR